MLNICCVKQLKPTKSNFSNLENFVMFTSINKLIIVHFYLPICLQPLHGTDHFMSSFQVFHSSVIIFIPFNNKKGGRGGNDNVTRRLRKNGQLYIHAREKANVCKQVNGEMKPGFMIVEAVCSASPQNVPTTGRLRKRQRWNDEGF